MQRLTRIFIIVATIGAISAGGLTLFIGGQAEYRQRRVQLALYVKGDPLTEYDAEAGFRVKRNGLSAVKPHGSERIVDVAFNPQGFRVPPPERTAAIIGTDILAVGCSFTFGHGVTFEEAFPAQAAALTGFRVVNAGVPAYGTLGALVTLRRHLALKPKVVVYGYIEDHLRRNVSPCAPALFPVCRYQPFVDVTTPENPVVRTSPLSAASEFLNSWLVTGLREPETPMDGLRGAAWILLGAVPPNLSTPSSPSPAQQVAAWGYLMKQMKQEADAIGARLVVLHIPTPLPGAGEPRTFAPFPDDLRQALPAGIEVLDVTNALALVPVEVSLRFSQNNKHPTVEGHSIIAAELAHHLRSEADPE